MEGYLRVERSARRRLLRDAADAGLSTKEIQLMPRRRQPHTPITLEEAAKLLEIFPQHIVAKRCRVCRRTLVRDLKKAGLFKPSGLLRSASGQYAQGTVSSTPNGRPTKARRSEYQQLTLPPRV